MQVLEAGKGRLPPRFMDRPGQGQTGYLPATRQPFFFITKGVALTILPWHERTMGAGAMT